MKVYKYRAVGDYFKRDLDSITNNIIYAPNAEKLNDPCETLVFSDNVQNQTRLFGKIFGKNSQKSGSMSFCMGNYIDVYFCICKILQKYSL